MNPMIQYLQLTSPGRFHRKAFDQKKKKKVISIDLPIITIECMNIINEPTYLVVDPSTYIMELNW